MEENEISGTVILVPPRLLQMPLQWTSQSDDDAILNRLQTEHSFFVTSRVTTKTALISSALLRGVTRPLLSLKRRPHFKTHKKSGKNKCIITWQWLLDGVWTGYLIYWPLINTTRNYRQLQRNRWYTHLHFTAANTTAISLSQPPLSVSWQRILTQEL
jgi:hypothetical protein